MHINRLPTRPARGGGVLDMLDPHAASDRDRACGDAVLQIAAKCAHINPHILAVRAACQRAGKSQIADCRIGIAELIALDAFAMPAHACHQLIFKPEQSVLGIHAGFDTIW